MVAIASTLLQGETAFLNDSGPTDGGSWETVDSFPLIRDFFGRSFAGTETVAGEPLMDWISQNYQGISKEEWYDATRFFMSFPVNEAMRKGSITFGKKLPLTSNSSDLPMDQYASMVVVREYDAVKESHWMAKLNNKVRETLLTISLILSIGLPTAVSKKEWSKANQGATRTFDNMTKLYSANHKAIMGSERHWYVNLVGTHPSSSGQGHGSEIMRRIASLADAAGMPCFLEANSDQNKCFYEKFGFECVEQGEFENVWDPKGDPSPIFYMVRRIRP